MRSGLWSMLFASAMALTTFPSALAEPDNGVPIPVLPAPVPPTPGIGDVPAQSGTQSGGLFGLPDLTDYGPNLLLGQNPDPAAPGDPAVAVVPNLNAFNPEYLLGRNRAPAAPGEGEIAPGLAPNQDNLGTGRIAFLRRLYEMYQAGALEGSLLGQQTPEQFEAQFAAPPQTG